ncbi:cell division protein FtsX [Paenalcaligenes hominis]|uniref:cell division protein FtsX n=1 Tax=Paenalcaligenes hominis TaxID=643674 RepID=UPI0035254693
MKSWLRQHQYAFRVALLRLLTQPFSSLSNITVVALALCLPIISWAILVSAQPVVASIPLATEMTVYLKPELKEDQVQQLRSAIENNHSAQIEQLQFITKDQAATRLKKDPAWADALSALSHNPLPDSFVIRLAASPTQTATATQLASELKTLEGVDQIQLDTDWLNRLEALLNFGRLALLVLSLSVVIIVVATVFNTIRLQALNQRQEIAVARLVGATESFVRRPFLYVGAISGGLSCLLAIALARIAISPLATALNRLALSYDTQVYLALPDAADLLFVSLLIMVITATAARWSVTRHSTF